MRKRREKGVKKKKESIVGTETKGGVVNRQRKRKRAKETGPVYAWEWSCPQHSFFSLTGESAARSTLKLAALGTNPI